MTTLPLATRTRRRLLTNAISVSSTTAVTSLFGFAYWFVAARSMRPADVGIASAVVSAATVAATLAVTGLGTLAIREIAESGLTGHLVRRSMLAAAAVAAAFGLGTSLALPWVSAEIGLFASGPAGRAATVILVVAIGLGLLIDNLAVGRLEAHYQLIRNAAFSVLKLGLLIAIVAIGSAAGTFAVVVSWLIGVAGSFVVVAALGQFRDMRSTGPIPAALSFAKVSQHYVLNAAIQVPHLVLPVIAAGLISSAGAGFFYISWMVASFLFVIPASLTLALFALTAGERSPRAQLRFSLGAAGSVAALGYVVLFAAGPSVLGLLGPAYRANGTSAMLLFGLGVVPLIARDHFVAIIRVRDALMSGVPILLVGGAIELALSAAGGIAAGLEGLAIGWLVAMFAQALLVVPALVHELRSGTS